MNLIPAMELNGFNVFLAIAAVGFLFLLISLFFGGIFDHFDAGLDHGVEHGGPGFFSTRIISVFVMSFGAFGAISTHYGLDPLPASAIGFVGGLVLATPIFLFARFLFNQQASSESRSGDLVGQIGRVIVGIPAGGVGQIRCRVGEELIDKVARTRQGEAVPENTTVRIEEVLGETVIVTRQ